MYHYMKIRDALKSVTIASMTPNKVMQRKANDQLTKAVREACGLD